jgi:ABC-type histidine transport system ATPase subunit
MIKQLAEDGMTMVLVTYEMQFARDVVEFMADGARPSRAAENLFANPQSDRLRAFLRRYHELQRGWDHARLQAHPILR